MVRRKVEVRYLFIRTDCFSKEEKEAVADESQDSSSKKEPTADAALFANVGKENKE